MTYKDLEKKQTFCDELKDVEQDQKLIVGIGLNLIGKLSDRCLDKEADFVLWKQSGLQLSNPNYNLSMAYFAKFISTESSKKEDKYLKLACQSESQDRGCQLAQNFKNLSHQEFYNWMSSKNEKNDHIDQLDRILELEFARLVQSEKYLEILKSLKNKKYVGLDIFLIQEKLKLIQERSLHLQNQRQPAQEQNMNSSKYDQKEKELIDLVVEEMNEL